MTKAEIQSLAVFLKNELKTSGLTKENISPIEKTEFLLRNYPMLVKHRETLVERYRDIRKNGIRKSNPAVKSTDVNLLPETFSDYEKVHAACEELEGQIEKIERFMRKIDDAYMLISKEDYSDIVRRFYAEGEKIESIAFDLGIDKGTVSRHRRELLRKISLNLFLDDYIAK